jgi:hypothetical protein
MKRLVGLSQLEAKQHEELLELLRSHDIEHRETPPSLLSFGSIWVREEDFVRARELLRQESAAFAAQARELWQREWREQYRGSYGRWFLARLRTNPAEFLLALLLLAFFLWLALVYPLVYLARRLP